jgi:hypothetical protein
MLMLKRCTIEDAVQEDLIFHFGYSQPAEIARLTTMLLITPEILTNFEKNTMFVTNLKMKD